MYNANKNFDPSLEELKNNDKPLNTDTDHHSNDRFKVRNPFGNISFGYLNNKFNKSYCLKCKTLLTASALLGVGIAMFAYYNNNNNNNNNRVETSVSNLELMPPPQVQINLELESKSFQDCQNNNSDTVDYLAEYDKKYKGRNIADFWDLKNKAAYKDLEKQYKIQFMKYEKYTTLAQQSMAVNDFVSAHAYNNISQSAKEKILKIRRKINNLVACAETDEIIKILAEIYPNEINPEEGNMGREITSAQ